MKLYDLPSIEIQNNCLKDALWVQQKSSWTTEELKQRHKQISKSTKQKSWC